MSTGDCCSCSFQDTAFLPATCAPTFALFMSLVSYVLRHQCDIADPCGRAAKSGQVLKNLDSFDFIVVGAGAAGSVVASRLGELNATVLVLEAGPEEPTSTQIPGFAFSAVGTPVDWNYTTTPQRRACLATGGVCAWPRGKMVGGTFPLNGMMYSRGNPIIYNSWEAAGNDGWSFQNVLPYFQKAESNRNPEFIDEGYHGFDGPLVVQRFPHQPIMAATVIEAGKEMGYREGDFCGKNQTGIGITQVMMSEGLRGSTSRMYLRKAAKRGNVHVMTTKQVSRVLVAENGRAIGVQYIDETGAEKLVFAREEVILSAGTIGSPQILLLSGIGPKDDLGNVGIDVIKDLPVGRNLQNHVGTAVPIQFNDSSEESLTMESFTRFLQHRDGPLASTGLTQLTAFVLSQYATDNVADLQLFFDGYSSACSRTGMQEECTNGNFGSCGKRAIAVRPTNILPRSRGFLKLKSRDPLDYPLLNPDYFSEPIDEDILVDGIKIVKRFIATEALQRHGFELDRTVQPGCENFEFDTEDYWRCTIRVNTGPENHQAGTCKMGRADDPTAVVDSELRVHGIPNLRVIDASIFPTLPNGNPISMVVMVAEKGADMIKEAWVTKHNGTRV